MRPRQAARPSPVWSCRGRVSVRLVAQFPTRKWRVMVGGCAIWRPRGRVERRAGGTAGRRKDGERGRCTLVTISSSGRSSVRLPPPPHIACRGACIVWSNGEFTFALVVYGCVEGTMRRKGRSCRVSCLSRESLLDSTTRKRTGARCPEAPAHSNQLTATGREMG